MGILARVIGELIKKIQYGLWSFGTRGNVFTMVHLWECYHKDTFITINWVKCFCCLIAKNLTV